jgi:hypothetical protein
MVKGNPEGVSLGDGAEDVFIMVDLIELRVSGKVNSWDGGTVTTGARSGGLSWQGGQPGTRPGPEFSPVHFLSGWQAETLPDGKE